MSQYTNDPYGQQQPPQPGGYGPGPGHQAPKQGFFAALFDISFDTLVTPSIVRVFYLISMAVIGLFSLIALIAAFASGEAMVIFLALLMVPLTALIYLVMIRMTLEMYYSVIRISEDVHQRLPGGR